MPNPTPGSHLGPFQIEGVIGAGSMGDVFRGVDTGLGRKVAIKILSEKHRDSNELRARFTREGRAVAAIQHPNVVQVFSTGTFDDRPYIAMELLEGTDLGTAVEENGPLPAIGAARAILDAARGLNAAAKAGLIPRDVKPSNLVLLEDGRVKVTDFGLAKPVDPGSEPSLTALGVVVGTPDYIAPEQARGEAIDERVDIYALGGTLYFLLTGTPPFRTGKPAEDKYLKVVARHLRQPAPDARTINPAADADLSDLARQLMGKKPAERPDYGTLIARLEKILARLEASGATSTGLPRAPDGSGGMVGKTPFVGGDLPHDFAGDSDPSGDDAAATSLRPTVPPQVLVPPDSPFAPDPEVPVALVDEPIARGGIPGWLKLFTVAAIALFGVGIGIYLMRGGGSSSASTTVVTDAQPGQDAAPPPPPPPVDAPPAAHVPTAPAGMIVVAKNGAPAMFVDAKPVTVAQFYAVFNKQKRPAGAKDDAAVTAVAYTFARAYAQAAKKRLIRADEWDAVIAAPGFVPAGPNQYEWVDAPATGDKRSVRAGVKTAARPSSGAADVTFRLALDLP
ncbi:MAG: serine/threonine protein kinase [Deltaproteobacteria bacterium]|nr:serine/threonine protein kinase [Deltaproteobacteria bacterium]